MTAVLAGSRLVVGRAPAKPYFSLKQLDAGRLFQGNSSYLRIIEVEPRGVVQAGRRGTHETMLDVFGL